MSATRVFSDLIQEVAGEKILESNLDETANCLSKLFRKNPLLLSKIDFSIDPTLVIISHKKNMGFSTSFSQELVYWVATYQPLAKYIFSHEANPFYNFPFYLLNSSDYEKSVIEETLLQYYNEEYSLIKMFIKDLCEESARKGYLQNYYLRLGKKDSIQNGVELNSIISNLANVKIYKMNVVFVIVNENGYESYKFYKSLQSINLPRD